VALGLPEVWSWVLTPVGLILVVVASVVATVDESSGAGWLLSLTVFLVLLFAYVAAAVGPSQFWHRLTTTPP